MSTSTQQVPAGTYQVDPIHSNVGFSVKAAGLTGFRSSFADYDATLVDGVLTGKGELTSMQISVAALKDTLLSPAFFDAENHPRVTFKSSDLRVSDDGALELEGELTMHGQTRPVVARGEFATGQDPRGGERVALDLTAEINRGNYGIDWQQKLPNGADAVGWEVKLTVQLQLLKQS